MLTLLRRFNGAARSQYRYIVSAIGRGRRFPNRQLERTNSTLAQRLRHIAPENYMLIVFPCISFYLGIWQIKRRRWKVDLIAELERKQRKPGEPVPYDLSEITSDREYETFLLDGEFDHSRETYIGPRVLIDDHASAGGLISSSSSNGVHVVTPFKLSGRDDEVLVNRGWISRKRHKDRNVHRPSGRQKIVGVYRTKEKGTSRGGFDERTNMWCKRNITPIADTLGTSEWFFDMSDSVSHQLTKDSPIPGQTNVQLRNEHLSYIFTWFSLTVIMLLIWSNRFLKNTQSQDRLYSMMKKGNEHIAAGKRHRK